MNSTNRLVIAVAFAGLVPAIAFAASRLGNISIRSVAGTGTETLIVGLSVTGPQAAPKPVLIRAVGPTLASFGVAQPLADPSVRLDVLNGATIAQNEDWGAAAATSAAAVGAFPLPPNSRDAALVLSAAPGSYSALVGGGTGVALLEVYDAAPTAASRLTNVSARTRSGTGDDVLIAGFVVTGDAPLTVLVRGIGPTLAAFGVSGALVDPKLELFRGSTLLLANDDWGGSAAFGSAFASVGAFPLSASSIDAALIATLSPGPYTVQVSGVGAATGIALVEIYELANSFSNTPNPTIAGYPKIHAVAPASAQAGAAAVDVLLTGVNLRNVRNISVSPASGVTVSAVTATDSQVTARISVAATAASGTRTIAVSDGTRVSNPLDFGVLPAPAPQITSITPTSAEVSELFVTLAITGQNLGTSPQVNFGPSQGITIVGYRASGSPILEIANDAVPGERLVSVTTSAGRSNEVPFTIRSRSGSFQISNVRLTAGPSGISGSYTITVDYTDPSRAAASGVNYIVNALDLGFSQVSAIPAGVVTGTTSGTISLNLSAGRPVSRIGRIQINLVNTLGHRSNSLSATL